MSTGSGLQFNLPRFSCDFLSLVRCGGLTGNGCSERKFLEKKKHSWQVKESIKSVNLKATLNSWSLVQKSNFSCAFHVLFMCFSTSYVNEQSSLFELICIRFGTWKVGRMNLAWAVLIPIAISLLFYKIVNKDGRECQIRQIYEELWPSDSTSLSCAFRKDVINLLVHLHPYRNRSKSRRCKQALID
jgi:hypothetical protein